MTPLALALAGAGAVLFGFLMLFQRTLYSAAMCLLMVLLQVALMFFLMGAQLLGLMQVLIYAGAIMVLIVIALMASPPKLAALWAPFPVPPWLAGAVLGILLVELAAMALLGGPGVLSPGGAAPTSAALPSALERKMAAVLFGRWALMTEAVGVLLLLAALSVVSLSPGDASKADTQLYDR